MGNKNKHSSIPQEVMEAVESAVSSFNTKNYSSHKGEVFYKFSVKGAACNFSRKEFHNESPMFRLTWTGDMKNWKFAIFKWTSEEYNAYETMFPGSQFLDGTVEGAMLAGEAAYPLTPFDVNMDKLLIDELKDLLKFIK